MLVLANRASPDSMNVARYLKQRRIPEQNLSQIEYQDFGKEDPDDLNPKSDAFQSSGWWCSTP